MSAWAVLLSETQDATALKRWCAELRRSLDDVVVVGTRAGPDGGGQRIEATPGADPLACVRAALALVPAAVDRLVYVDEPSLAEHELIAEMLGLITDDEAGVVRVVAVTDALKRVEQGAVLGGVTRHGLFAPRPPQVLRRSALEALPPGIAGDPAAALAVAGHRLRILRDSDHGDPSRPGARRPPVQR